MVEVTSLLIVTESELGFWSQGPDRNDSCKIITLKVFSSEKNYIGVRC